MEIDDFLEFIASEKGLSEKTIEAYSIDIAALIVHLKDKNITLFKDVKDFHIIGFLSYLKSKNYKTATVCRKFVACKVFFKFLKREGVIDQDPAFHLDTPKSWQLIPDVLTTDEIEKIFLQCNVTTENGARDLALLELLYASGLRVSEACNLSIYDVDDEFVKVMGKGRKERIVPIGKKAIDAIDYYLIHFRECKNDRQEKLFVKKSGSGLNRIDVFNLVKKYAKVAGIVKNISPHTFRHSFATHLLDNGADLRIIQEMLGHASIGTTDRYTHISKSKLQASFEAFHNRF